MGESLRWAERTGPAAFPLLAQSSHTAHGALAWGCGLQCKEPAPQHSANGCQRVPWATKPLTRQMSSDTAEFAVESIRQWWKHMGQPLYPRARSLLICADSGGSNGYRLKLWKRELQSFATEQRLTITVCHFPPGTSKWNKIEHKLFSFITMNWSGRPLTDSRTIVNLIAGTKTQTGLTVKACLDRKVYKRGIKVSAQEMKALKLKPHSFQETVISSRCLELGTHTVLQAPY